MNRTKKDFQAVQQLVDNKDNMTRFLISQNAFLRGELEKLDWQLNNVTSSKLDLEGQLGKVKTDLDGLKSNTSRLEGEKKGLEKVLEVKGVVDDDVLTENSKKTRKDFLKKQKKKLKLRHEDESEEEEEQNESSKSGLKDIEKKSIEKIVKEHIEKLGLNNSIANAGNHQLPAPILSPPINISSQPLSNYSQAGSQFSNENSSTSTKPSSYTGSNNISSLGVTSVSKK